jgi:hypothetical protein
MTADTSNDLLLARPENARERFSGNTKSDVHSTYIGLGQLQFSKLLVPIA